LAGGGEAHQPIGAVGTLFRDLRRLLGLSLPDIAHRLGTRIDVLVALETGDMGQLPLWPETARVVSAYTGLAGIDPRPVLGLIRQEMARQAAPIPATAAPGRRAARGRVRNSSAVEPGLRRLAALSQRVTEGLVDLLAWTERLPGPVRAAVAIGLIVLVGGVAVQGPMAQGAFAALNAPISRLWRTAGDYWALRSAPVREGLRWIEVEDPRSRRGDKLAPLRSPQRP
jgi:transcriptional regulator with XRE-family HTH domain